MKRMLVLVTGLALNACASVGTVTETVSGAVSDVVTDLLDVFSKDRTAYVREVGHTLNCGSTGNGMSVQLFPNKEQVKQWEQGHGLSLLKSAGGNYAYALVDMGQQPTGGYGVAVSRKAEMDSDLLTLKATLFQPEPEQVVTQQITDPCVLIALPKGEYTQVAVKDQNGSVVAQSAKK